MRKPRSDSKLKMLPDYVQEQLYAKLEAGASYATALDWLYMDFEVSSSLPALSAWYSWYRTQERLRAAQDASEALIERLAQDGIKLDSAKHAEIADAIFLSEATVSGDEKAYALIRNIMVAQQRADGEEKNREISRQRLATVEAELRLKEKKFERDSCELFLKWVEDEEARSIALGAGSQSEKIEALGRKMFGDDWDDKEAGK